MCDCRPIPLIASQAWNKQENKSVIFFLMHETCYCQLLITSIDDEVEEFVGIYLDALPGI